MEHKKAIDVLINLSNKSFLSEEEKEAVLASIGILGWYSLSKGKIKAIKNKREKGAEWSGRNKPSRRIRI